MYAFVCSVLVFEGSLESSEFMGAGGQDFLFVAGSSSG